MLCLVLSALYLVLGTDKVQSTKHKYKALTRRKILHRDAHALHNDLPLHAALQDLLNTLLTHLQTRDHYLINLVLGAHRGEISIPTKHAQPVNDFPALRRIVIKKTNRSE